MVTNYKEIIPNSIDSEIIKNKKNKISGVGVIIVSVTGASYNIRLEKPMSKMDLEEFFNNLAIDDVDIIKLFNESTFLGDKEHSTSRIEFWFKEKPMSFIHCKKIHGFPD
ncbi:MAG: hypothetical protein WC374_03775 [Phycisphaerae bacterium]|jgi:hypothetical protein